MKARAGKKKVVLELGGNAGVIVERTADLDWAVKRCLIGAFAYAGQVCISVQRMFVHESICDAFMEQVHGRRRRAQGRRSARSETDLGPMVDANAGQRTQRWVDEAVALGGTVARGRHGRRHLLRADDPRRRPARGAGLLERGVRPARGRVPVRRLRRGDRRVNDSSFGLQTGVFTNDLADAWRAFGELEVGGVIVNDIPTYRIDHMPYGGVKDSGLGREGLR